MGGYEHVAAAHELLCGDGLSPRQRLESAAELLWRAMPHAEGWPPALQRRAVMISSRLFRRGGMGPTLRAMTDREVGAMVERLEGFARDFLSGEGGV